MSYHAQIRELWRAQRFEDALKEVDVSLDSHPEDCQLWIARGDLIQLQPTANGPPLTEAERCYLRALELRPRNLKTLESLAHLYDAVLPNAERAKHFAQKYITLAQKSLSAMDAIIRDESYLHRECLSRTAESDTLNP